MKMEKEINTEKKSVKFTIEIDEKEAREYAKALQFQFPQTLDPVPDVILWEVIKYQFEKFYAKK